jgi:hypothetical protein
MDNNHWSANIARNVFAVRSRWTVHASQRWHWGISPRDVRRKGDLRVTLWEPGRTTSGLSASRTQWPQEGKIHLPRRKSSNAISGKGRQVCSVATEIAVQRGFCVDDHVAGRFQCLHNPAMTTIKALSARQHHIDNGLRHLFLSCGLEQAYLTLLGLGRVPKQSKLQALTVFKPLLAICRPCQHTQSNCSDAVRGVNDPHHTAEITWQDECVGSWGHDPSTPGVPLRYATDASHD